MPQTSVLNDVIALALGLLGGAVRTAAKAMRQGGYSQDEARQELLDYLAEVLTTDEHLDRIQERRQARLDARIPPHG